MRGTNWAPTGRPNWAGTNWAGTNWAANWADYGNGGGGGLLATAGGLLFAGDGMGSLVAHDAKTGKPLWNTRIGNVTNAPQTFLLDGHQYLTVATGDTLWAFVLN